MEEGGGGVGGWGLRRAKGTSLVGRSGGINMDVTGYCTEKAKTLLCTVLRQGVCRQQKFS